ncbi:OadG family protein [Chloroflexota bacterium]
MGVDWGQAALIGSTGFGTVFLVLVILTVTLWLTGLVFTKMSTGKEKPTETKKGA